MRGSSEQVRDLASERYVKPAIREGKIRFSVAVRDVIRDLVAGGFPAANTPQVCSALRKKGFLRSHGIEIEAIEGPPSKTSTTVVYRYRVADGRKGDEGALQSQEQAAAESLQEDSDAWALRVTEKIRGLLKKEIAELGGAEGYMRWVRSDNEDSE